MPVTEFRPGQVVCESVPYALAVSDQVVATVCAFCLKRSSAETEQDLLPQQRAAAATTTTTTTTPSISTTPLQRCSGCRFLHFCSRECQVADWGDHKAECANLKRSAPRRPREPARLMARILLRWKREHDDPSAETLLGERRRLKDCMDHRERIKMDRERAQGFVEMLGLLKQFMSKPQLEGVPDIYILQLFGVMCINTMHIADDDGQLGSGLYLAPSLIDHSCRPNLSATFRGRRLQLRAVRPIAARSVADLSLAYVELHTTRERRRADLSKAYYFQCECELCSGAVPEVITEARPALTERVLELRALNLDLSNADNSRKALDSLKALLDGDAGGGELAQLDDCDVAKLTALLTAADAAVATADYRRAHDYYLRSLPVLKQVYSENSSQYAHKLVRLARLSTITTKQSRDPDQVPRLVALLREAARVSRQALGEDHFDARDVALLYEELLASLKHGQSQQQHQEQAAGDAASSSSSSAPPPPQPSA